MSKNLENDMMRNDGAPANAGGSFLRVAFGFLAGALSGAAVALLLAPSSGRDARTQITDAYRKSTDKVARLPAAFKSAGIAARAAFAEARAEEHAAAAKNAPVAPAGNAHPRA